MSQAGGAAWWRARLDVGPVRKARAAVLLLALGLALGGCGNCGGWTNPWYGAAQPHSCQSDPPAKGSMVLPLGE
ncbi:MAG: hypothetical protein ACHQAY_09510 [Hyphomicrobiales bacterium]